ncbi:hypothetical protein MMAG44476_35571 [Mycolicibacterium mageritense DSM 44476 = CIP 104973]|jgi:hypothetical protein|uniref:Cell division protein FtsK/SpoIIIE n=1 Tax=Mycolicibacterium canariasense TaxID=228230 RepID=A0A100W7R3_MYCCR|nr:MULTISPECIES: hypothetical protein [Mycolicibacterium]MCC9186110.1 hypothetical protein [Mycolicibacterium mageritense]MCV7207083.1 hypothetical protein [Mycolicibacterium canariasense]ORV10091.1 hypothetical protein AWB94_08310 [Mycolicibacterium canariasense]GAS93177.1 cell division protein FtsK/SpoIIIE, precursor [Mycolicibacterium canariasense]
MEWYWWVLTAGGYIAAFILVAKLTSKRGTRIFLVATLCALILGIPFSDPPASYFISVLVVFDLLVLVWPLLARDAPAERAQH